MTGWLLLGLALVACLVVAVGGWLEACAADRRMKAQFEEMSRLIRKARREGDGPR